MLEYLPEDSLDNIVDEYSVLARFQSHGGESYEISAKVYIVDDGVFYRYYVVEPFSREIWRDVAKLIDLLRDHIVYDDNFFMDPVKALVDAYQDLVGDDRNIGGDGIYLKGLGEALKYYLIKTYMGYEDLTFLIADENVEDVSCVGPGINIDVWHKRFNSRGWIQTNVVLNEEDLHRYISKFAFRCGKSVNIINPVLEGVLPEGYRVTATWRREVSPKGSSFTIRKFRSKPYTIPELIHIGMLSTDLAAYLWRLVELKKFIMIIGASGAGKTTMLNALAHLIPSSYKIISIEEVQEIYLPHHKGWKPFITRIGGFRRDYTIFDLLRVALRERADYILLGESRGEEARLIFQGAATGHGCITTFHASNIDEMVARLTSSPISLDPTMMNLIDTVLVVSYDIVSKPPRRRVEKIYRQLDGRWILMRDSPSDFLDAFGNYLRDLDLNDLHRKSSFLSYLVSINSFDLREFMDRLHHYYQGRYVYSSGRWVLTSVG